MRTCEYYPISIVEFDKETGHIKEEDLKDGFEDDYFNHICYKGSINNEDSGNYTLHIPETPELNRDKIYKNLDKIKEQIKNRVK